jgi:hypothetical protein
MILVTTLWTFWGAAEMYHEGWWGAWTNRLPYLAPLAVTLIPTLVAFRWPLVGGGLIVLVGAFAIVMFGRGVSIIGLLIALVGAAFVVDGALKPDRFSETCQVCQVWSAPWWRRRGRYLLALALPALVLLGVSATRLPVVLTRIDDGDRGARLIEGNGLSLVWAPEGPGWNWVQPWGGYASWQSVALYGAPPLGMGDKPGYGRQEDGSYVYATAEDMAATNVCRYLSADGAALLDEPLDVWRLPTTDEVVRSLGRHGDNAGCEWSGGVRQAARCQVQPDKESPLWATDHAAIYYWTADAYSEEEGYFVAYNGTVNATRKSGGNPRHSYRCVREP